VRRTLTATGTANEAVAWRRYVEPALWPSWSPQIARVDTADAVIRTGTTGRVVSVVGLAVDFTVTSVDEVRHRWSWTARAFGVELALEHLVTPTDDGGSRTAVRVTGPAPVVLAYAPLATWALRRLVRA
jgi:hypothetical protein